jgi:Holliday junction resolvase RusA-like endonuclease
LRVALDANLPDFALIKQLVEQAYTIETGQEATDKAVASWIRNAARDNPNFRGLLTERKLPRYVMFPDAASKFEYLMQRPCDLCLQYQMVDFIRFMLHTPPVSRQVARSGAFKDAVQDYLGRVQHDFTDFYDARLCVAVTFVLSTRGQSPDLDNLAKILLDALQGYAYGNDNQIDHLDLVRGKTDGNDSFIGIRIAVTDISDNSDTVLPEFNVRWVPTLGVGPIDLTPYV